MNSTRLYLITTVVASTLVSLSPAQTFDGGAVSDLSNWSGGDPTVTQGTVDTDGVIGFRDPAVLFDPDGAGGPLPERLPTPEESWVDGFDVIQNGGVISVNDFNGLRLVNSTWVVNSGAQFANGTVFLDNSSVTINDGGSLKNTGARDLTLSNGATILVNTGGLVDAQDDTILNSGTGVIIDGGTFQTGDAAGNQFRVAGTFTVNSGILHTSDTGQIGSNVVNGGGVLNFNGGTTSGNRMSSKGGTVWNFGGSTAGTFTVNDWGNGLYTSSTDDRQQDNNFLVNFKAGSQMAFIMGSSARALDFINDNPNNTGNATTLAWAEALWNEGQLTYTEGGTVVSGADPDTNGWTIVSWTDATNSGTGFGTASGEYFDWTQAGSFGGTLLLADVGGVTPQPLTITSFSAVDGQPGVWQLSIAGTAGADFIFRSSTTLDFTPGTLVENLTAGVPAAGAIGGTNDSVVTTDGGGAATVRMTLTGAPSDFVRAEDAP